MTCCILLHAALQITRQGAFHGMVHELSRSADNHNRLPLDRVSWEYHEDPLLIFTHGRLRWLCLAKLSWVLFKHSLIPSNMQSAWRFGTTTAISSVWQNSRKACLEGSHPAGDPAINALCTDMSISVIQRACRLWLSLPTRTVTFKVGLKGLSKSLTTPAMARGKNRLVE